MIVRYKCVDGNIIPIHKIVAYKTIISDDDLAENHTVLKSWYLSDQGNFFKTYSESLKIDQCMCSESLSTIFAVIAEIEESKLVEYYLKFPKEN